MEDDIYTQKGHISTLLIKGQGKGSPRKKNMAEQQKAPRFLSILPLGPVLVVCVWL